MAQLALIAWIVAGYGLARFFSPVTEQRVGVIRRFAFTILTPILFFSSMIRADLATIPSILPVLSYLVCMGGLFITVKLCLSGTFAESHSTSNIKSISALYPNAVGVGVPLVFSLYGAQAEMILMGVVFINLVLVLPLFNVLMIRCGEKGFYGYKKVVTDPILIAIVLGAVMNLGQMPLPESFLQGLAATGQLALPVILLVLGASLGFYNIEQLLRQRVGLLLFIKIVGFPLAALTVSHFILHLSLLETQVLVLLCSLPTGINVYLLAERYQVARESTASVIVGSTLLSVISVFSWEAIVSWVV